MRYLLALAILLAACASPLAPPDGAEPFAPLPVYETWWADMTDCAEVPADFYRVEWLAAPDGFDPGTGQIHHGMWKSPHTIYIARQHLSVEWLVKHEMLHDILQTGDHGPVFVACDIAAPYYLLAP